MASAWHQEESGRVLDADALLDRLPDATVLIDADGFVLWMNRSAEERVGAPRRDYVGRRGLELVHPDDLPHALFSLATVQEKRVGTPIEVRIRTADGWRLAEVLGAPTGDGCILMTMRDLTERRRWEVAGDETAKLRTLVHHAPSLFLLLDAGGRIVATSGAITRALGHDQAAVEEQPIEDLVARGDRGMLTSALRRALARTDGSADPVRVEVQLLDARRQIHVPYELSILNLVDDPTVGGLIVTGHDVSDRVAAENELHETVSLLNATLDSTVDGMLVVDLDGRVTSVNSRFVQMWKLPRALAAEGTDDDLLAWVADQLHRPEQFVDKVHELYADPESVSFDVLTFEDGRVYERTSTPQRIDGEVVGRVWSFHDITRQKQLEAELEHQAFHDSLTGLSNQALFRDRVAHAVARSRRDGTSLAVLYLDMDDFKRVNDSLGHPFGDELLVGVAERLRECVREADTAARLGGDEFAILIEHLTHPEEATEVAARLLQHLHRPFRIGPRELVTSVSLGVAFNGLDTDGEQLLRNADLAMYAAKRSGKGTFEVYQPTMHAEAVARLELESELRDALHQGQFWLAYQPVVELANGAVRGVEALLRWTHPEEGELHPGAFLAAAEDMGLMPAIGGFVIAAACRQAAEWADLDPGTPFHVSVNVAASQLADGSIVRQISEQLERTGLAPERLVVELTETAMLHDTPSVACNLRAIEAMGVRIALDDFGTGFSSIAHLQQFPIHVLKIDRSFMTSDDHDAALVRALVHLAEELGLTVVAEGVETPAHATFLRDIGCRYGQGHHFAPPGRAEAVLPLLEAGAVLADCVRSRSGR